MMGWRRKRRDAMHQAVTALARMADPDEDLYLVHWSVEQPMASWGYQPKRLTLVFHAAEDDPRRVPPVVLAQNDPVE